MTMNNHWGYNRADNHWKSTTTLVRNLIDCASKGGNYLLNVGPTSEGLIPAPSLERLKEIGDWMKVNGVAIYGTTASPFPRLTWGRCTAKAAGSDTMLYLHVFDWPTNGVLGVPGLHNRVKSARLLAGNESLNFRAVPGGLAVQVPARAPDAISSTVALTIQGQPEVTVALPGQAADGSVTLPASEADLQGSLRYEVAGGKDNIGYWTEPHDTASWTFSVTRPGKFTVSADIAAEAAGQFEISVPGQQLRATAPRTGDYTKFQRIEIPGQLDLANAGEFTLVVQPVAAGWQPMNLKSLVLQPAAP